MEVLRTATPERQKLLQLIFAMFWVILSENLLYTVSVRHLQLLYMVMIVDICLFLCLFLCLCCGMHVFH